MAKIIIHRHKEFINRARNFKIVLDINEAGTLAYNSILELNVSEGSHILKAKIDWCESQELTLDINDNEVKEYEVKSFTLGKYLSPLPLVIILFDFLLKRFFNFEYLIYLIVPLALIMLYYLTIGRNHYLVLKEKQ
jgi:hypothetical protein